MVSVFDLEQLQSLLRDFYQITRIRITVFDSERNELVAYPEHSATFCTLIRATQEGRTACAQCDAQACAVAARQNRTQIYRCHAGLTEAIMPLYVGKVLVGYLLCGQVFPYESAQAGWEVIRNCCETYPVDLERLQAACLELPQVSPDYIRSAARILHATASYMVLERMATLKEDSAASRLDAYLSEHYTQPITAELLCQKLNIGRTRLYKLSQQIYGCGISQQVRKLRMERAKNLLLDCPDMTITEIATDCGFSDYNYFIAVFSRTFGKSPNLLRKERR